MVYYLNTNNIPYTEDEVSFDIHVKPYIYDYLIEWAQRHSTPNFFEKIKNFTLADVINTISRTFIDTEINTKALPEREDVLKMQNYIKKDISELTGVSLEQNLRQEVEQVLNSTGIQQNLQKFSTHTQANFQGAKTAIVDLQNKNNILNQKCNELEKRIEQLEMLINKGQ